MFKESFFKNFYFQEMQELYNTQMKASRQRLWTATKAAEWQQELNCVVIIVWLQLHTEHF